MKKTKLKLFIKSNNKEKVDFENLTQLVVHELMLCNI